MWQNPPDARYFVDLFAGCGGLSLGLESAGYAPAYVNEVNEDALETYMINRDEEYPLLRQKYHSTDIRNLTVGKLEQLNRDFYKDYGIRKGELGIVTGGPPCQGFSTLGHRRSFDVTKEQMPYNHLYVDMVRVINVLNPRMFLFENVEGMLHGKWTAEGTSGEIWDDVYNTFKELPYVIRSALLLSKNYGVPQNRPRIMMVGVRNDIYQEDFAWTDVGGGLLPGPLASNAPDLVDLLGDLVDPDYLEGNTVQYKTSPRTKVQRMLRDGLKVGDYVTEQEYSNHSPRIVAKFQHMLDNDGEIADEHKTKKFFTKVLPERWGRKGPNVTITSNPSDLVHFSQPRNLTVREYARMQTFPDTYKFHGKRTTGGRRRAGDPSKGVWDRELPKYTQIANAVPVWLGAMVGRHLSTISGMM